MSRLICLAIVLLVSTACVDRSSPVLPPTSPGASIPTPGPAPIPAVPRPLTVGEEINDTFIGEPILYELTAPRDGTLIATLSWDPFYNGSLLVLNVNGTLRSPVPPAWSPVSGSMAVASGQTYRLSIQPGGTDWWYGDKFVLVTTIQ